MAKRVNYGFGKRQKEIKRQKKKEEKAAKKRLKKEGVEGTDPGALESDGEEDSELGEEDSESDDDRASDPNPAGTWSG